MGLDLNPFDTIPSLILGLIKNGQMQNWLKLIASLLISAIVTALTVFGTVLTTDVLAGQNPFRAFCLAIGAASMVTAGVLIMLWKNDPATKNIPIAFPSGAPNKALEGGVTVDPNKQK